MAITIKSKKLTLASLVARLFDDDHGHTQDQANVLVASGFKLETGISKFTISVDTGKEYTVVSEVSLKLETVKLCLKHQVGPTVTTVIRTKVKHLISTAYLAMLEQEHPAVKVSSTKIKPPIWIKTKPEVQKQKPVYIAPGMAKGDVMAAYHKHPDGGKVAAIKVLRNLTGATLNVCKTQVEKWIDEEGINLTKGHSHTEGLKKGELFTKEADLIEGTVKESVADLLEAADAMASYKKKVNGGFDLANEESVTTVAYWQAGTTVKIPVVLKNATQLHQPVRGTDPDSVYHVIAIGDDLVVAARIRSNHDIAIRAVIKTHHATLIAQRIVKGFLAAGLEKKKGGHWSLHLSPPSLLMAQRSIGSTLFAMDARFSGISTSIEQLQGAGA